MLRKTVGLHELYASDPERADWQLFGRRSHSPSRRGFLNNACQRVAVRVA